MNADYCLKKIIVFFIKLTFNLYESLHIFLVFFSIFGFLLHFFVFFLTSKILPFLFHFKYIFSGFFVFAICKYYTFFYLFVVLVLWLYSLT